jgi:hypothetical protein
MAAKRQKPGSDVGLATVANLRRPTAVLHGFGQQFAD